MGIVLLVPSVFYCRGEIEGDEDFIEWYTLSTLNFDLLDLHTEFVPIMNYTVPSFFSMDKGSLW